MCFLSFVFVHHVNKSAQHYSVFFVSVYVACNTSEICSPEQVVIERNWWKLYCHQYSIGQCFVFVFTVPTDHWQESSWSQKWEKKLRRTKRWVRISIRNTLFISREILYFHLENNFHVKKKTLLLKKNEICLVFLHRKSVYLNNIFYWCIYVFDIQFIFFRTKKKETFGFPSRLSISPWSHSLSTSARPWGFTQETGSSSSTACTSIWTFTILSGGTAAPGVWGQAAGLLSLPGTPSINGWTLLWLDRHAFDTEHTYKYTNHLVLYSILDILRREARVLEGLYNLGITGEHQGKLLRLPVGAADDSYALDIRHPAIMVSPVWPLCHNYYY